MTEMAIPRPCRKFDLGHEDWLDPACTASIGARDPLCKRRSRALVLIRLTVDAVSSNRLGDKTAGP
jgi:hypothetical protein